MKERKVLHQISDIQIILTVAWKNGFYLTSVKLLTKSFPLVTWRSLRKMTMVRTSKLAHSIATLPGSAQSKKVGIPQLPASPWGEEKTIHPIFWFFWRLPEALVSVFPVSEHWCDLVCFSHLEATESKDLHFNKQARICLSPTFWLSEK